MLFSSSFHSEHPEGLCKEPAHLMAQVPQHLMVQVPDSYPVNRFHSIRFACLHQRVCWTGGSSSSPVIGLPPVPSIARVLSLASLSAHL